jgi:hypothetical protein
LVVGAVDGIEICSSFARCCDACMAREVQHKVNGENLRLVAFVQESIPDKLLGAAMRDPIH